MCQDKGHRQGRDHGEDKENSSILETSSWESLQEVSLLCARANIEQLGEL